MCGHDSNLICGTNILNESKPHIIMFCALFIAFFLFAQILVQNLKFYYNYANLGANYIQKISQLVKIICKCAYFDTIGMVFPILEQVQIWSIFLAKIVSIGETVQIFCASVNF